MAGKGLDKLSALVSGASKPPTREEQQQQEKDEEQVAADAQKVLDYAASVVGEDAGIFDLQILIEYCAEELRNQIREASEGDGDEG